jgi:hypothetical protein
MGKQRSNSSSGLTAWYNSGIDKFYVAYTTPEKSVNYYHSSDGITWTYGGSLGTGIVSPAAVSFRTDSTNVLVYAR